MKDVFISYTSADQAWADWLAWVLENDDYTVDAQSFEINQDDNIAQVLQQGLKHYRRVLLILSKALLQADAVTLEGVSTVNLGSMGQNLIPIEVEDCQPVGHLELASSISLAEQTEFEAQQTLLKVMHAILRPKNTDTNRDTTDIAQEPSTQTSADYPETETEDDFWGPKDYEYRDQLKLRRRATTVKGYREQLTGDLSIAMIKIPAGHFVMGSPENESERLYREGPQHEMQVPQFFMGKYPVTQAEWRWVAENLPQVNRELDPEPSVFKGDRHPVESISWDDAVEFCDRLSLHTGRTYRLPSEAEWEYACRANTQTPFHFGETITTTLANYNGQGSDEASGSYGKGPEGTYRQRTNSVDQFEVTNGFGLCDMHGNVWEWCRDQWHRSHNPNQQGDQHATEDQRSQLTHRVARGGSWYCPPSKCRSASRFHFRHDATHNDIGFRVLCSRIGSMQKML